MTRDVVYAIIYNPETDKYLILNNLTGEAGQSFIVGGIETGEDSIECGIREIQEETGYQHLKHIRKIDGEVHANFYAIHKDENRYAKAVAHLYELEDETQTDINEKERNRHELLRLNQNEINIRFGNQTYFWKAYLEGESAYCEKGVLVNSGAFS
ncbi:MAG: NUDIX domain-containing protein [Candidatus Peribacteria bacterium]|nr:NUDIX domain-containing protein [Candidatus Peribacteria bacterium]